LYNKYSISLSYCSIYPETRDDISKILRKCPHVPSKLIPSVATCLWAEDWSSGYSTTVPPLCSPRGTECEFIIWDED
jgi:hypothetical protein